MIFFLTTIFAILGIIALLILFNLIFTLTKSKKLSFFRSTKKGFTDLLNYASLIEDGIILGKDGSLSATYKYTCQDSDSLTDEDKEFLCLRLNNVFKKLGNGWLIHIDSIREQTQNYSDKKESFFESVVPFAIDEERREYFNNQGLMYESTFYITFTYLPPLLAQQKFVDLMFEDNEKQKTSTELASKILKDFKKELENIENSLMLAISLARMKSEKTKNGVFDNQLSYIFNCITGNNLKLRLPQNPMFLDHFFGCRDFWGGIIPKLGNKYIQCIAIDGLPTESTCCMLNALSKVNCNCRWNSRFIFLDQHEAISEIKKYQKKWKQRVRGLFDQLFNLESRNVDQDALSMEQDCDDFLEDVNSQLVACGYYTSVVVLEDSNREILQKNALMIVREIEKQGFSARLETINNMEAFFGSLPTNGIANIRRPLIHTLNFADLIPTSSIWSGEKYCPCDKYPANSPCLMYGVTDGSSPFRLNIHVKDIGHTLMIGPTGSGKSTHLALLASQLLRYKNISLFCFDKGMSMFALNQACKGSHFEIGSEDSTLSFCPLGDLTTTRNQSWACDWINSIMQLNGLIPTPEQNLAIKNAITSMANSGEKSISSLLTALQDEQMKQILELYCGYSSAVAKVLDGEKDNLELSKFTVFEIEELMNLSDRWKIPVLLYLFKRIEDSLKGQPAVIILDEAWLMLGHPVFREKIREWLKVLRKANCAVIMATQSISDASNSGILDVIAESTSTKIFLPNSTAKDETAYEMYTKLGLNSTQINLIAHAIPKHDYYLVSSLGARMYSLALGKIALAFVAVSDKESIKTIKKLITENGDNWVNKWLELKKINIKGIINEF